MEKYKKYIQDPFFSYIMTCWAILGCEFIVYFITQTLHILDIYHYVIMIAFWMSAFMFMCHKLKKEQGYEIFTINTQPTREQFTHALVIVALFVLFTNLLFGGLKIIQYVKIYTYLEYIVIVLYNICELLLAMMILVLGQHLIERFTNDASYMYGGSILALTWALLYCFVSGFGMGIYMMAMAISVGFIYQLLRKNAKLTFILFILMYLL
ncbi:MAG: hypothetical protein IKM20_01540 [Erysipelotrichales bacterium]|nr:hypothetical protein [Erysipelotrichales bacterium]